MSVTGDDAQEGFGDRLRYLRKLAGFERQSDLAEAAGLEKMAVSRAENAHRYRPRVGTVQAIIAVLRERVSFEEPWLAFGVGEAPGIDPTPAAAAVDAYLASEWGKDAGPDIARRLRLVPWDTLGVPTPTPKQIQRMRDLIETNLREG